jgi:hypothetical protein
MLLFGPKERGSELITYGCKNILQCILAPSGALFIVFLKSYAFNPLKIEVILGLLKRGLLLGCGEI